MKARTIQTGQLLIAATFALSTCGSLQAGEAQPEIRSISTEFATNDCAARLGEAMRDLQADVTGPLAASDYQRIRDIFAPLCSAEQPVLSVDESGRRISTAPLSSAGEAGRPAAPGTPAQPIEPVLLLDLDLPRERRRERRRRHPEAAPEK